MPDCSVDERTRPLGSLQVILSTTINLHGVKHLLLTAVVLLGRHDGAHALLAESFVQSCFPVEPPLAMAWRLHLCVDRHVKQGRQYGLAIDRATAIRDGSAICALPDCASNIQSLNKLCRVAINAQLALHVSRCRSSVLL